MSLYDGVDIDHKDLGSGRRNKSDLAGWSPGLKLLQPQLQNKRPTLPPRRRPQSMAPVVDLKGKSVEGEYRFNQLTGKMEKIGLPASVAATAAVAAAPVTPSSFSTTPFVGSDPVPAFAGITNEYNPLYPNDYEEVVKRKREEEKRQKALDREKELEEREKRRKERHREMGYDDDDNRRRRPDSDDEDDRDRKRRGGAAIAPPTALIQQDEKIKEEVQKEMGEGKTSIGLKMGLGGSVAAKLMAKMGYKEGQGLGKSEQGMSQALMVEKTSKRGGKIIHEKDLPKDLPRAELGSTADLLRNPSKVILLRNMVGPGEVDEELEPETAEECGKYGKVIKCVIFEMPEEVDDEAVRIFVEFEKIDAAIKAVIDLHGRYFGGRTVKGGFYNLDKFRRLDLMGEVQ